MAGLDYEIKHRSIGRKFVVGLDEAGRGPIAGPLVVAACILPVEYDNPLIDDSKKLTEKKRELLFEEIKKVAPTRSITFSHLVLITPRYCFIISSGKTKVNTLRKTRREIYEFFIRCVSDIRLDQLCRLHRGICFSDSHIHLYNIHFHSLGKNYNIRGHRYYPKV